MVHKYRSTTKWSDEEDVHATMDMDSGFSCKFHKPAEFGGVDGLLNPEDAFVGSLAMCYSITFQEIADKMRLDIDDFELTTVGILEETDEGRLFTTIRLEPVITSDESEKKILRAVDLVEDHCLISRSMKSKMEIRPKIIKK
ncbi:MAG: OsmC family protein [Thermoplasmata archaeon]